jgi:hypothetical protein
MRAKYEEKRKAQLLLKKPPSPMTEGEKLTREKLEVDAMEDYKP